MATIETTVSAAGNATLESQYASRLLEIEVLDCLDPEPASICPLCWGSIEAMDDREPKSVRACIPSNVFES